MTFGSEIKREQINFLQDEQSVFWLWTSFTWQNLVPVFWGQFLNFINVICAAFALADSENAKKIDNLTVFQAAVDKIDP